MIRYTRLVEDKRRKEAAEVLRKIEPKHADSPYVQARMAEVLFDEGKIEDATTNLLKVWFAPTQASTWPADYAWKAARGQEKIYEMAKKRFEAGERPTPRALFIMATYAMEGEAARTARKQPLWRFWFPGAGAKTVLKMLERASSMEDRGQDLVAILLQKLSDKGYYRHVVRFGRKNPAAVADDSDIWSLVGRSMIEVGARGEAEEILSSWRSRKGVKMWMVTNYINTLPRFTPNDRKRIMQECEDALTTLPHDHCAKYLAHIYAESAILAADQRLLREIFSKYKPLFGKDLVKEEWFAPKRKYLMHLVPLIADAAMKGRSLRFYMGVLHLWADRLFS